MCTRKQAKQTGHLHRHRHRHRQTRRPLSQETTDHYKSSKSFQIFWCKNNNIMLQTSFSRNHLLMEATQINQQPLTEGQSPFRNPVRYFTSRRGNLTRGQKHHNSSILRDSALLHYWLKTIERCKSTRIIYKERSSPRKLKPLTPNEQQHQFVICGKSFPNPVTSEECNAWIQRKGRKMLIISSYYNKVRTGALSRSHFISSKTRTRSKFSTIMRCATLHLSLDLQ